MSKDAKYIVTYHGEVVFKTKNEKDAVDTAKFYAYANKIDYSIIIKKFDNRQEVYYVEWQHDDLFYIYCVG